MQLFKLRTNVNNFDHFSDFADAFKLSDKDLVITHRFLFDPFMKELQLPCHFVMQEKYGTGEPSDEMINRILADINNIDYDRVVAVGGGTVIDIAKLFVLQNVENITAAFERKIPIRKVKKLVILPTTCGTGSEVTNISIAEIKSKQTKMGLADDALLADHAVLIPELLKGLPFDFYLFSAIDALIHAAESFVSPKANPYTRLFSQEAIRIILNLFSGIAVNGKEYRFERLEDMLIAANYAGIAFGNAGVGSVHALSYPLGSNYHVPHGEANYQFFTEVFKLYGKKNPNGSIRELNRILSEELQHSEFIAYSEYALYKEEELIYEMMDTLLGSLITKNQLRTYGMKKEEIEIFTANVFETQQRLLANNYVPFTQEDIKNIYSVLY
jgi:4-hydroxybutyrate dehydrogenase